MSDGEPSSVGRVRLAGPGDAEEVARLMADFRDLYDEATPEDDGILRSVRLLLEDGGTEFLLTGEPAVGVVQVRYRHSVWTGSDDAWLEDIFVRDEARRTGAGRALAEACLDRARRRGCRRIQLDANERNAPALALYESLGFTVNRRPSHGGRDLCLTLWL